MSSTHPRSIHEFRETTKRHAAKMEGVQSPARKCSLCGQHKRMHGYTIRAGKFICADCK